MIFLHIDSASSKNTKLFNKYMKDGKHIFVLFYMEGCGPCNATRPEWKKIENVLSNSYKNRDDIVVVDIEQDLIKDLSNIKKQPMGFPNMQYISKNGDEIEEYEECKYLSRKDRTIDSFVEWIDLHMKKKNMRGGKWSLKYKRSIDCKQPKGFSQRQHCLYGRGKNKSKSKCKKQIQKISKKNKTRKN